VAKPKGGAEKGNRVAATQTKKPPNLSHERNSNGSQATTERESKKTGRNSDLTTQGAQQNATYVFLLKLNKNLYNHGGHRTFSLN
jgi:hypothetical protein